MEKKNIKDILWAYKSWVVMARAMIYVPCNISYELCKSATYHQTYGILG